MCYQEMAVSFQHCFSKTEDTCNAPCVLEYRAGTNDENPTCVPPTSSLRDRLRAKDVAIIKKVLIRLLPSVPSGTFSSIIQNVRDDLGEYVNSKIIDAARTQRYSSWGEAVVRISQDVTLEIESLNKDGCAICCEPLNDISGQPVYTTANCCNNVMHKSCHQKNMRYRRNCAICRKPIPQAAGLSLLRGAGAVAGAVDGARQLELIRNLQGFINRQTREDEELDNERNRQVIDQELQHSSAKEAYIAILIFVILLLFSVTVATFEGSA